MYKYGNRLFIIGALAPAFVLADHLAGSGPSHQSILPSLINSSWAADYTHQPNRDREASDHDPHALKVASTSSTRTIMWDLTGADGAVAMPPPKIEPWLTNDQDGGQIEAGTKPRYLAWWLSNFAGAGDAKLTHVIAPPRAPSAPQQVAALAEPRAIVGWLQKYEGGGPVAADIKRKKLRTQSNRAIAFANPQDIVTSLAENRPRKSTPAGPDTLLAAVPWNQRFDSEIKEPIDLLAGLERAKQTGNTYLPAKSEKMEKPHAWQGLSAKVSFEERYNYIVELTKGTRVETAQDYPLTDAAVTISEALDMGDTAVLLENLWAELPPSMDSPADNWDLAAKPANRTAIPQNAPGSQAEPPAPNQMAMANGNPAPLPGAVEIEQLAPLPGFWQRNRESQMAKSHTVEPVNVPLDLLRKPDGPAAPLPSQVEMQALAPLQRNEVRPQDTAPGTPSGSTPEFEQLAALTDDLAIDESPMSSGELRDLRGGINLGNGLMIDFVGHIVAEQDGVLVFDTLLHFPAAAAATLIVNGVSVETTAGTTPPMVQAADGGVLISAGDIINSPQILADFPSGNTTIINSTNNVALAVTSTLEINIGNAGALFSNGLTPQVQSLANTLNTSILPR